jgi:hypothetical protein
LFETVAYYDGPGGSLFSGNPSGGIFPGNEATFRFNYNPAVDSILPVWAVWMPIILLPDSRAALTATLQQFLFQELYGFLDQDFWD